MKRHKEKGDQTEGKKKQIKSIQKNEKEKDTHPFRRGITKKE